MAGLMMFNPAGAFQDAYKGAQEQKRVGGLRELAGEYYGQQDPMLGKVAALGGDAAGMQDRQREQLGQYAALLVNAPQPMRAGLYKQIHPQLVAMGLQAPPEYTPEIDGMAAQIAQQFGRGGQNTGIQSTFVDANGQRMGVTRDGRTIPLGQNAPQMQLVEGEGGYFGVNKGNLQAAPVTMGGQMPPQAPQQPAAPAQGTNDEVLRVANAMAQAGVPAAQIEAWMAKQPGIQPVSQHEAPQAVQQPMGRQLQPAAKPQAQRAPTELERRVQMAQSLGATPDQIRAMVVGGGQSGNAQASKTNQANRIKMAQLDTVQRQIDRLEQASESLAGNALFDGGPLDQYAVGFTRQGQELEQSGAAILPVLTALTRVPGVGAQSDLESRLASLQIPSANMHPEVRQAAVKALREYMADLKAAYQNIGGQQAPTQAPAAGGWSIKAIP